jgi:integrase
MEKLFKSYYPKGLSKYSRMKHAESEDFEFFRTVIKPNHERNPFSNFPIQLRNYLLIEILYWTGCRPSEVLSLILDDIDYDIASPSISFKRRHDNPTDPRKSEPTLKTQERNVEIPPSLISDLDYYIRNIRSTFNRRKVHSYIFVSHKGKTSGLPMTDKTFSEKVFQPIKHIDKRFKNVQRRGVRIYFNERFSEQVDDINSDINDQIHEAEVKNQKTLAKQLRNQLISEGDEIDARQLVMGHSSPDSARPYLKRHVERKARKVHKEMMKVVSKVIKEVKDERDRK